jgi:hypothetical protein
MRQLRIPKFRAIHAANIPIGQAIHRGQSTATTAMTAHTSAARL